MGFHRAGREIARHVSMALVGGLAIYLLANHCQAAVGHFDNGGGDNTWETPTNWVGDALPLAADNADINVNSLANDNGTLTVSLSSAQTLNQLFMGDPSTSGNVPGTSTLNILPGANLQINSTSGVQIGRPLGTGQLIGSSTAVINQTGGTVTLTAGTNGFRMSQDGGNVADTVYNLSGGSLRGGTANGTMTAPLQIGGNTNSYNRAEFHMIGSTPVEARFEDIRVQAGTTGSTLLHFSLDNNGVTPMIAEDELRFSGTNTNSLAVDLIGLPPTSDITLIMADRLTTANNAPAETFTNMPDGTAMHASFGGVTYNWTLKYQDGGDNGVLDAFVKLLFVSKSLPAVLGDFNRDGSRTSADLPAMFEALTNLAQYETDFSVPPADDILPFADVNQDGSFDNADVQTMLAKLQSDGNPPPTMVPEPAAWRLMCFAALGLAWMALRGRIHSKQ